ncbi:unnamed protein product [Ilex paraguariensis]|uniref:Uncharacterized protein n=1 Tax=Ilex paraguariensis TaxID=185542 RepID=A0ABC8SQ90_9AQUA
MNQTNIAGTTTLEFETHSTAIPYETSVKSCSSGRNRWLQSIMNDGGNIYNTLSSRTQMQKVPQLLRMIKDNRKYYEPTVVSFGPYHHGRAELAPVENSKVTIARQFVLGSGKPIEDFYDKVAELVDDARSCYLEGSTEAFSDQEFAQMMFLDGCFNLYVMECVAYSNAEQVEMMISHLGLFASSLIVAEMFLLENQLPFFVLWNLMNIKYQGDGGEKMISVFINYCISTIPQSQVKTEIARGELKQPLHLLELIRSKLLCKHDNRSSEFSIQSVIPRRKYHGTLKDYSYSFRSVMELKAKGIYVKPSNTGYFTDINFKSNYFSGQLTLPPMIISPFSRPLFVNLIAYEMCPNTPNDLGVAFHIHFMKSLIDHPDDVKELRSKCILHNLGGSDEEVARMFKEIATPLMLHTGTYEDIKQCIQKHYNSKMRTYTAEVIHNHFSNPWTVVAFLTAIFLMVLSIIQAYFTWSARGMNSIPPGYVNISIGSHVNVSTFNLYHVDMALVHISEQYIASRGRVFEHKLGSSQCNIRPAILHSAEIQNGARGRRCTSKHSPIANEIMED